MALPTSSTSDKMKRLKGLASKVPVLNEQAASRIAGGRALQMQKAAAAAPQNVNTRQVQQMAPQIAAESGAQQLQQQQVAQQQDVGIAQQALQTQAAGDQQQLAARGLAQKQELGGQALQQQSAITREQEAMKKTLTEEEINTARRVGKIGRETDNTVAFMSRNQREDLAKLGADVKEKLFDSNIQFERDEQGRKFSNERQMAEYAISSAKSEQEMQQRATDMEQNNTREIYMMEMANAKITQALENGFLDNQRELNENQKRKLQSIKSAADREIERKKRSSANQKMIIGGAIVVAAVAITVVSGGTATPATAAMGAAGASYASGA